MITVDKRVLLQDFVTELTAHLSSDPFVHVVVVDKKPHESPNGVDFLWLPVQTASFKSLCIFDNHRVVLRDLFLFLLFFVILFL